MTSYPPDRLTPAEIAEQRQWMSNTFRLGQSGNREALHAELLRQENEVIALLLPEDQEYFRSRQNMPLTGQ